MSKGGRNFTDEKCASKLKNLRRTWNANRKPGATKRNWQFTEVMNNIFKDDATVTLENVAEVGDKKVKSSSEQKYRNAINKN
jgi:hypothetical protein